MRKIIAGFAVSMLLCNPAFAAEAGNDDAVFNAMEKELSRSFKKLKKAEKIPLYYLNYEITDSRVYSVSGVLGAVQGEWNDHSRQLDVDVRVGSHEMDNTHEIKGKDAWMNRVSQRRISITVEDDEDALRAVIWKWTDRTYKDAQERYTKVRMNKAVTAEAQDPSDDFSKEEAPGVFREKVKFPGVDKKAWRERVRKLSEKFKEHSFIYGSNVNFHVETENRRLVSSEGVRVLTGNTYITLSYSLTTRTTDGMDLRRRKSYEADVMEDMPSDETVLKDIEISINELKGMKTAQLVEPYTGPAILRNRASGVFFHEIFGHRMEGHRQKRESEGQTFAKKVGQKVLSEFISVYDDPTIEKRNGQFLRGYYRYDNEGVKAARVTLVEKGILRGFLMNRSPIRDFKVSNGHGRRSHGFPTVARQGNLIIESTIKVPFSRLREQLIEECKKQKKPYGLIFDDISGGFTMLGRSGPQTFKVIPLLVYRVYVDGRPDEIVRGVDIVGTPLTSFNKIISAADDEGIFNGTCGAESGWVAVSAVSPSILVSEIEVEKVSKSQNKPPVLEPPYFE